MIEPTTAPADLSLHAKAELALKQAVAKVVEAHRRSGLPLAVWRAGTAALVTPQLTPAVHERHAEYTTSKTAEDE
jgi:hypothetical protein